MNFKRLLTTLENLKKIHYLVLETLDNCGIRQHIKTTNI
jgi:hypothetical protein